MVVDAYRSLCEEGFDLWLILVPRHPERCRGVAGMLAGRGFNHVLRSRLEKADPLRPGEILLVDTVGEMLNLYAMADVVFVGGSLVPVGGHNILEASLLGKPVVFGSGMRNFKEIARLVVAEGGGIRVAGQEDLLTALRDLLADPERRQTMGEAGHALLARNQGATARTLDHIRRRLPES